MRSPGCCSNLRRPLAGCMVPSIGNCSCISKGASPEATRLIYHDLIETPLVAVPGILSPALPPIAHPATIEANLVSASPPGEPPSSARRHRMAQRRQARRQKQVMTSAIAVSIISFATGVFAAWLGPGERSLSIPVSPDAIRSDPSEETVDAMSQSPWPSSSGEASSTPELESRTTVEPEHAVNSGLSQLLTSSAPSPLQPVTSAHHGLSTAANLLTVPPAIQPAIKIKAVGDIIPGTNFPNYRIPDANYLFNSVQMFMGEVDILFGNFESTLTDYPYSAKDTSRGMTFAFRTPPEFANVLQAAGFDVLSVANNHAFDFGFPGFEDTIAHIEQVGMRAVGRKDDIVMIEANGYAIAFIGFSYWDDHNNLNDLTTATNLVRTAAEQADMVVISVHAGAEGTDALRVQDRTEYFLSENRGNMVQFSRAMVDAGADLILGHGPHVPRAIELYQNKLIAYSLGNFVGYRTLSTVGPLGKSLILQVELNPEGDFLRGRVIPVALDPNGVPYVDDFFESVTLVRQLTAQDFPETPLEIDQMGYILRTN
jgi:hypothetical protein